MNDLSPVAGIRTSRGVIFERISGGCASGRSFRQAGRFASFVKPNLSLDPAVLFLIRMDAKRDHEINDLTTYFRIEDARESPIELNAFRR